MQLKLPLAYTSARAYWPSIFWLSLGLALLAYIIRSHFYGGVVHGYYYGHHSDISKLGSMLFDGRAPGHQLLIILLYVFSIVLICLIFAVFSRPVFLHWARGSGHHFPALNYAPTQGFHAGTTHHPGWTRVKIDPASWYTSL